MAVFSPCKDCEDRTLGCHSTCKDYIEFKNARLNISKKRLEQQSIENDFYGVRTNRWK